MIRFEYRTYCNEYKIIKVSRKAYIIKYIDYYQHICWMVKEHKFKSRLKAEKHIKNILLWRVINEHRRSKTLH